MLLKPSVPGISLDRATNIKQEGAVKSNSNNTGKKRAAESDNNPRPQQFKRTDEELEDDVLRWFEFGDHWELRDLQQKLGVASKERLKRVLQKFCFLMKGGPLRNKYRLKDKYKTK